MLADVLEARIAHERAGQKAGFGQDLVSVADAEDETARSRELLHRLHNGREAGDGAGAEIVTVGKAAGNQNRVHAGKVFGIVPKKGNRLTSYLGYDVEGVVIAIRTREDQGLRNFIVKAYQLGRGEPGTFLGAGRTLWYQMKHSILVGDL